MIPAAAAVGVPCGACLCFEGRLYCVLYTHTHMYIYIYYDVGKINVSKASSIDEEVANQDESER